MDWYMVAEDIPCGRRLFLNVFKKTLRTWDDGDERHWNPFVFAKRDLGAGDYYDPYGGKLVAYPAFPPVEYRAVEPTRYKVIENISEGDFVFFDKAQRTVRAWTKEDFKANAYQWPHPAVARIPAGYYYDGAAIYKEPEPMLHKVSHLFWKPDLPVLQPKYGESAMKSEALGGQPKPKRHWIIRRGDHLSLNHTDYAWIVELHEGENKPEHRIHSTMLRSLHFWPEKRGVFCTRQMTLAEVNDEIVKSKARLLGEQAIVDSQSGPANRMV